MIYTYKECKEKYKTDYTIRKMIAAGELRRIGRGLYSDMENELAIDIISKNYPNAVLTMNSAFYYHGLTDAIPQKYHLITDKDATKIKDKSIKQYFDNNDSLELGVEIKNVDGAFVKIFSKERLLVELIRNKNKLSFDLYKEIISNYRKIIDELDIQAIQEYAEALPKTRLVMETLRLEVF